MEVDDEDVFMDEDEYAVQALMAGYYEMDTFNEDKTPTSSTPTPANTLQWSLPALSTPTPAPSTPTPAPSTPTPAPSTPTPAPSTHTPAPSTPVAAPSTPTSKYQQQSLQTPSTPTPTVVFEYNIIFSSEVKLSTFPV
jgi:hypothetical protein